MQKNENKQTKAKKLKKFFKGGGGGGGEENKECVLVTFLSYE